MFMSDYLTTKEAAENLGVSVRRVQELTKSGRLPSSKFGRALMIKEEDLELVRERTAGRPPKFQKDETLKSNPASGLEREN